VQVRGIVLLAFAILGTYRRLIGQNVCLSPNSTQAFLALKNAILDAELDEFYTVPDLPPLW